MHNNKDLLQLLDIKEQLRHIASSAAKSVCQRLLTNRGLHCKTVSTAYGNIRDCAERSFEDRIYRYFLIPHTPGA